MKKMRKCGKSKECAHSTLSLMCSGTKIIFPVGLGSSTRAWSEARSPSRNSRDPTCTEKSAAISRSCSECGTRSITYPVVPSTNGSG